MSCLFKHTVGLSFTVASWENESMRCDLIFLHSVLGVFYQLCISLFCRARQRVWLCVCVCVQQHVHSQARWASYWPFYRHCNNPCDDYKRQRFRMSGLVFVCEFAFVSVRVCRHATIDLLTSDVSNIPFQKMQATMNLYAKQTHMHHFFMYMHTQT